MERKKENFPFIIIIIIFVCGELNSQNTHIEKTGKGEYKKNPTMNNGEYIDDDDDTFSDNNRTEQNRKVNQSLKLIHTYTDDDDEPIGENGNMVFIIIIVLSVISVCVYYSLYINGIEKKISINISS